MNDEPTAQAAAGWPGNPFPAVPMPGYTNHYTNGLYGPYTPWPSTIRNLNPLPVIEIVSAVMDESKLLQPPAELIAGVLKEGGKLLVAGAPKIGKSFLLIQLALAVACGTKWLGCQCKQGKALYVNLEIGDSVFEQRVFECGTALGLDAKTVEANLDITLLPTTPLNAGELALMLASFRDNHYDLIVIDPIYKLINGQENQAGDVARYCEQIDRIRTVMGSAVACVHHHSKGYQGRKDAADRSSGSGVFARDVDALIDIIPLTGNDRAYRAEFVLRDFREHEPVNFRFVYPLHQIDERNELAGRGYAYTVNHGFDSDASSTSKVRLIEETFDRLIGTREWLNRRELHDELKKRGDGWKDSRTLDKYLRLSDRLKTERQRNSVLVFRRDQ